MIKSKANNFYDPELSVCSNLPIAKLRPPDQQYKLDVMKKFGIEMPSEMVHFHGLIHAERSGISLAFGNEGSYDVHLAKPNLSNSEQIPLDKARSIAHETIRIFKLDRNVSLVFDGLLHSSEGGQGSGSVSIGIIEIEGSQLLTQTTILFRQVIIGFPVLTPGMGELTISVDNDGSVIAISSSVRQVKEIICPLRKTLIASPKYGPENLPDIPARKEYEKSLDDAMRKLLASRVLQGQAPVQFNIIPGSTEIGYDIRGEEAIPIARRAVEIDFGEGYHKRYWVIAEASS